MPSPQGKTTNFWFRTLGPAALALCGASDPDSQKRINAILAEHGPREFAAQFFMSAGLEWAADLLADFPTAQPHEGENP